jgi:hypothetical protein
MDYDKPLVYKGKNSLFIFGTAFASSSFMKLFINIVLLIWGSATMLTDKVDKDLQESTSCAEIVMGTPKCATTFVSTELTNEGILFIDSSELPSNSESGEVIYTGNRLYFNNKEVSLKEIPNLQLMYDISKVEVGRWAKLFIAIKMEESGVDGKQSGLARVRNNLVGMRMPRSRETYAVGETVTGYAIFNNWYEATLDFAIFIKIKERGFQKKYGRLPKDEHEFVNYMYGSYNIYSKWQKDVHIILRRFRLA